jgi:hypothetical protein
MMATIQRWDRLDDETYQLRHFVASPEHASSLSKSEWIRKTHNLASPSMCETARRAYPYNHLIEAAGSKENRADERLPLRRKRPATVRDSSRGS